MYTSTNAGANWATHAMTGVWQCVASSSDGTKLAAGDGTTNGIGSLYTSTDSGVTWTAQIAPILEWWSISSSIDGNKLAAVGHAFGTSLLTFLDQLFYL